MLYEFAGLFIIHSKNVFKEGLYIGKFDLESFLYLYRLVETVDDERVALRSIEFSSNALLT